jgi:branched-chain amino acid transport system permease protein
MLKKSLGFIAKNEKAFTIGFLIAALLLPLVLKTKYAFRMATVSMMYMLLVHGLNFLVGFLGQNSFGHSAFWGIGAYTTAVLSTKFGFQTLPCIICTLLLTGILGLLLGVPSMKMRGVYIVIVTVGFCEIMRLVELNWMAVTNGPLGIKAIPKPMFFGLKIKTPLAFYYYILILLILVTFILSRILKSRFGRAIVAVREDEIAASAMGVNVFLVKIVAFAISAMVAGLVGTFYAQYMSYIDSNAFTTAASTEILVMVIFGGLGSMVGPFIGAGILTLLPELMRSLSDYRMLIYGLLLVVLMLVQPTGIMGKVNFEYIRQRLTSDLKQEK